jgi:hypothetical protein
MNVFSCEVVMGRFPAKWKRRSSSPLVLLFLAFGAVVGCGKPSAPVAGTVTYKGKPLAYGHVIFFTSDGLSSTAEIQSDGTYAAPRVMVGDAKVAVSAVDPKLLEDGKKAVEDMRARGTGAFKPPRIDDEKKYFRLPSAYGDPNQSGITYKVVPGDNKFNIELKERQ